MQGWLPTSLQVWLVSLSLGLCGCNTILGIESSASPGDGSVTGPSVSDGEVPMADHLAGDGVATRLCPENEDAGPPLPLGRPTIVFKGSAGAQSLDDSIDLTALSVCRGDLLLATLYASRSSTTVQAPPGWTLHADRANTGADFHAWWFYRFADVDEPLHNVFALKHATTAKVISYGTIVAYEGVDPNGAFYSGALVDLDKNNFVAPSVTTAVDGLLVVTAFVNQSWSVACTPTPPLRMRSEYGAVWVGDFDQPKLGVTGPHAPGCPNAGPGAVHVIPLVPFGLCCP